MKRREFIGLNLALGASAFAPNLFAKESLTIYGAPAIPSVIIAVAVLRGELKKQKDLSLQIWKTPEQLRAGVANGTMQVMMSPSNVGVNLANQGQDVAMLNLLTANVQDIVTKDENIKSIHDLEGKKLIMPFRNDMPDIIFNALCKKLGVDVKKISIDYTATPPESMGMFLAKDYDAALLPEPMATAATFKAKQSGIKVFRMRPMQDIWGEAFGIKPIIPQAGIIVKRDFYEKEKESLEIFHKDLQMAMEWIEQNPESAGKIGENYLPAKAPVLTQAFKNSDLIVVKASEAKSELMNLFEIIMEYNPKLLGGKLPNDEFFL
ncbi:MAG: ABC transporter substrate-binding protein [Campylobacteraceae bacterium]|nr:ABC transporter substrate-binding protein [Campylobacteraceae bacterium]